MTSTATHPSRLAGSSRVRTVLGLFKLRIGSMIMVTALVGMVVAPGALPAPWQIAVLALSVLAASAAAGARSTVVSMASMVFLRFGPAPYRRAGRRRVEAQYTLGGIPCQLQRGAQYLTQAQGGNASVG